MTVVTMPELHVGRGTQVGPLTVFPVWATGPGLAGLATGAAARVTVAERQGQPVVGELVLTNNGTRPALLVEGELLEGGWQHRALVHDLVIPAGRSMVAEVVCVEAGRWNGGTGHSRRARRASGRVRACTQAAGPATRQQQVWRPVADYDRVLGASPTSSYVDHLDRLPAAHRDRDRDAGQMQDLPDRVRRVRPLAGQRGVVVGVAGQPALLEVYPSPRALAAHLPGLLTGLLLDAAAAHAPHEPTPSRRARRLIERLDRLPVGVARGVDAGAATAVRADTDSALLRGVTIDDAWAHWTLFNRRHPLLDAA